MIESDIYQIYKIKEFDYKWLFNYSLVYKLCIYKSSNLDLHIPKNPIY